jgi:hypothetical protein
VPGSIRDIGFAFEKIEKGLSRFVHNEEVLLVIEQLKEKLLVKELKILLIAHGECAFRPNDRYQSINGVVETYQLEALPDDIKMKGEAADIVVFAILDPIDHLDRTFKDQIKDLSRNLPNACLAMTDENKREANSMVSVRRQRAIVLEERRRDLASILKKIGEETPLSTFVLAKNKASIEDHIDLLDYAIKESSQNAAAKSVINSGEFLEMQIADVRILSKQLSVLKTKLQRSFKSLSHQFEMRNEDFFGIAGDQSKEVREKIEAFKGFREEELGKNLIVKMTDGFKNDIYGDIEKNTSEYIQGQIHESVDKVQSLRKELDAALKSIEIDATVSEEEDLPENTIQRIFDSTPKGSKELERSFSKKGMYALFMELRTPLFMLMPIIMLVMLLKPVLGIFENLGKEDYIDRSTLTFDGRPAIKVVGHPRSDKILEIYDLLYSDIEANINARDLSESPFFVGADLDLVIDYEEVTEDKKTSKQPRLRQEEDGIYVILKSDRETILPAFENTFLSKGGKTRAGGGGGGIGVIFKMINKIPHSEYILLGLIFLIIYYIRVKLNDFNREVEVDSADAKRTIKGNFKGDIERYISTLQSKWKTAQDHWMRSTQDRFVADLENNINRKIDFENKRIQELKVLYDKRSKKFKETEKELKDFQKELIKLKQEVNSCARL